MIDGNKESSPTLSNLRDRLATALDIKQEISNFSTTTFPCPPVASDLNLDSTRSITPPELFNIIAESRRILTIAQDIIYLASNRKKVMPKHVALGMAVRHLSGSAQLVGLLNGFGHSVSHSFVLEHDTALAQQEVERGSIALPSCIQTGIHTTLVWDNNDFGQETLSGKGTMHNTNGIAVQHSQCQLPVTVAQAPSTVEAKTSTVEAKKTKQRSLVAPDEDIIMFVGEKKSSPEAFSADIELELGPKSQNNAASQR